MSQNAVNAVDNEIGNNIDKRKENNVTNNMTTLSYAIKNLGSFLNLVAYLLIGATVATSLLFALSNGLPIGPTRMHIILCVLGYQLLMALAILSLSSSNGWSAHLSLRDKRRAHTVLQVAGSALALAGSFLKTFDKEVYFNTLHGQYSLVATVFTSICLVNGLTSLYAYEWRNCLPSNLSKLTHICFGVVAFAASSISLCYGFYKKPFRAWATEAFTTTLICFTGIFTVIIIFNPLLTFYSKTRNIIRR